MRKFFHIIFSLLFIMNVVSILPSNTYAADTKAGIQKCPDPDHEVQTELGCFPNNPVGFVQKFYGYGLSLVGMAALLALILGGYNIMTSSGNQRRLNIGKSYIFYAIMGLLLGIFGYVVVEVIFDILKVPGT